MRAHRTVLLKRLECYFVVFLVACPQALLSQNKGVSKPRAVHRVLLLSIDGAHGLDLANYLKFNPQSTLARLSNTAVTYTNANIPTPADNHEGTLSMVTGGTPISTGVYFDETYDRALSPPGSNCSTVGSEVIFAHEMDVDSTKIDGGGGIDPSKLPRDPRKGCAPVYPHNFLRVNTVFELVKAAGMRTAWSDKHFNEDFLNGPSGKGVDDLYIREINYEPPGTHGMVNKVNQSLALTEPLDDDKAQSVINEIDGFDHSRTHRVGVPGFFGMAFQNVTVAEMQPAYPADASTGQREQPAGGYLDALGTPSPILEEAWNHTDKLIGKIVDELQSQGLLSSTLIIVTGVHGQTPMDVKKRHLVDEAIIPKLIGDDLAKATYDDIDLIWLKDQAHTSRVAAMLSEPANEEAANIQSILSGESLKLLFPDPLEDSRVPDIIVIPNFGVMYGKPTSVYRAEHGGFTHEDTNVPLLVSNPGLKARVIKAMLSTTEIAPTILQALGLDPLALQAVQIEHTRLLPGLFLDHSSAFVEK